MAALTFPAGARVLIDANILIYSVEKSLKYWPLLEPVWVNSRSGLIRLVGSELLLLETLVVPLKAGNAALVTEYENLFASGEIEWYPVSPAVLRLAAQLRTTARLKTPDAIHAATALLAGCSQVLTNDPHLRHVPGLAVQVLQEALRLP